MLASLRQLPLMKGERLVGYRREVGCDLRARRRGLGGESARDRLHLHRRARLASLGAGSLLLGHAGRHPAQGHPRWHRDRGAESRAQVQRDGARRRPQPARLRARFELSRARARRRRPRDPRVSLAGQVPEQPQRRHRALGWDDLLLRPVVRPLPRLRDRALARAWLAGSLPDSARWWSGRARPCGRRGRVRHAERSLLLTRRVADVHQRHAAGAHQGLRRQRGRHPGQRSDVLRGRRNRSHRGGHPRRDEMRRAWEHLGHGARRRLGHLARRRASRHDRACPRTSAITPGVGPTGTRCSSRRARPCTPSERSSVLAASPTCGGRRRRCPTISHSLRAVVP